MTGQLKEIMFAKPDEFFFNIKKVNRSLVNGVERTDFHNNKISREG